MYWETAMQNALSLAARAATGLVAAALLMRPAIAGAAPTPATDAPVATAQGDPAAPPMVETAAIQGVGDDANGALPPLPDHKPHGFVSVGVGTNGYRQVAGAVTLPLGETGQMSVAIDDSQYNGRRR
jgi:hypothetical protein